MSRSREGRLLITRGRVEMAVAVLVPTAIFTWVALRTPVNFDGAMNLQAAQHLAHHGVYGRFYHVLVEFPPEVKTNGPFIFLAALSIRVVGENQLGLQLANLLFVGGTAAVVYRLFRHWSSFAVVAPALTLLLLPQPFLFGLAGLGEIPAIFFLLLALTLLFDGLLIDDHRRTLRLTSIAFLSVGLSVSTKAFMLGSLGAVAVAAGALVLVARVRFGKVLLRRATPARRPTPLRAVPADQPRVVRLRRLVGR